MKIKKHVCFCSDETGLPLLRVGEQDEVRLAVRVKNQGEDAHEATLEVLLPKALPFMNTEVFCRFYFNFLQFIFVRKKQVCRIFFANTI